MRVKTEDGRPENEVESGCSILPTPQIASCDWPIIVNSLPPVSTDSSTLAIRIWRLSLYTGRMAQQGPEVPDAPFPAPPPFWKYFTAANVQKVKELESSNETSRQPLPLPLAYLRPPPPPSSSAHSYTAFAQSHVIDTTKPALPPLDQLLFDPDDPQLNHAVLLTRLTKSLLLNFLELMTALSLDPTKYEEKMSDIRQLVLNVHAVINMYRPHQAREGVKEILEGILEDGQREIEQCDHLKGRIEDFLGEVEKWQHAKSSGENDGNKTSPETTDHKLEETKRIWKMVHELEDD